MTPEERIAALESEVTQMRQVFNQAVDLMQFLSGSERVFQGAILALVAHFPDKDKIRPDIQNLSSRAENSALFDSSSESHVQGAREAKELLALFLEKR